MACWGEALVTLLEICHRDIVNVFFSFSPFPCTTAFMAWLFKYVKFEFCGTCAVGMFSRTHPYRTKCALHRIGIAPNYFLFFFFFDVIFHDCVVGKQMGEHFE